MKIQQNMDVQNGFIQDQTGVNSASKSHINNKNSTTISGANLKGDSLISQRQSLAKKQALKVVSDAFGGEKKLDAQMQGIKDEIQRLQDEINEKTRDTEYNSRKLKELQEEYGVASDSKENKELEILGAKMRNPNVDVSDEELSRLSEYQQKALYYVTTNQQNSLDIDHAKAMQQEMIENIKEHAAESGRTSADIKKAIARREREDANQMDISDVDKTVISDATSMQDTQNAVNSEITNILNRLSLLSNDIKGTSVDSQI